MDETLSEPEKDQDRADVALLTLVLSYDDLLAPVAATHRLAGPLAIGRAAGADITRGKGTLGIPDKWMSSRQARLEQRRERWILVDAGSRNGTFVRGERIAEHALCDGDLLELGHTLFVFRQVTRAAAEAVERAPTIGAIRTRSPAMALLLRDLARIAASREPVLILAETGAGKESLAAAVHAASARAGAFRAVDCGAIPEALFESTLFGHRRGAFTSAVEARTGEIVRASGGSLFLDELGNLPASAQAKLLRVIEEGLVVPVGAAEGQRVDVRWIGATNRELFDDGGFRADLLRRLAGWVARIPPLRERREDLGELSAALLTAGGFLRASISPEAARVVFAGPLPGNVRELGTTLRSAALLAGEGRIEREHLPAPSLASSPKSPHAAPIAGPHAPIAGSSPPVAPAVEPDRATLEAVLTRHRGNVVRAGRELGTSARQLYRWIARHGLDLDSFR